MKGTKKILIVILVVLMIGQYIQFLTGIVPLKPLYGATEEVSLPDLNLQSWNNRDLQGDLANYVGAYFGFRSFFIRLNNQLYYSVFKKSTTANLIIGKKNYIFEKEYIKSYYGDDFIGREFIDSTMFMLNTVNKFLNKNSTQFVIVITPNKANYFPEYIPSYLVSKKKTSNYDYYLEKLNEKYYNVLDVNAWFLEAKEKMEYPLMTKTGTHWSNYGASLFADSLTRHIAHSIERGLYHFVIDSIDYSKPLDDSDNDLENLLNIFTSINDYAYPYPSSFYNIPNEDDYKPTMLVIGDSFFWNIYREYFVSCFKEVNFWYYFNTDFSGQSDELLTTKEIDVASTVAGKDVLVLLTSVVNLENLGFGFIDHMYEFLNMNPEQKYEHLLPIYIQSIKNNNFHLKLIEEKAIKNQISLDSMIYLDAGWLVDRQLEKLFSER